MNAHRYLSHRRLLHSGHDFGLGTRGSQVYPHTLHLTFGNVFAAIRCTSLVSRLRVVVRALPVNHQPIPMQPAGHPLPLDAVRPEP